MKLIDLPLDHIHPASFNANEMDAAMGDRLRRSIQRFGLVLPLVVRRTGSESYETIGGAQRLAVLRELDITTAPCILVNADDAEARLLSQALNRIAGSDNPGLRAELLRQVLKAIPQEEVVTILPETVESLASATSMGEESVADYLRSWESTRHARLHHCTFQLTSPQVQLVEQAITRALPQARQSKGDSPNDRGISIFLICKFYLDNGGQHGQGQ